MKLYNTATRKKEDINPIKKDHISMYTCGPTVYDYPHIGNWYTFIRYDMLYRLFIAAGYKVNWVMNITDVGHLTSDADEGEDKLEKGAKRENVSAWDVAKKYTDYFVEGLDRLHIHKPTTLATATEHIDEQIDLVKKLEKKGHTYVIDDGVYFDTTTFKDYGKMAKLDLEGQEDGARIDKNSQKRNPSDFALWKFSPKDSKRDMEWDSPWGKGFPGWHLECSAMSMKYLGATMDIHGGGIDHIPVHHTNEIAQSEAVTGKPFVRTWFHSNFNLVDGKKMSKSKENFFTLEDIEEKGFDLTAFRLLVLQSHYRSEAHFSWENLQAAQNLLEKWRNWAVLRFQHDALIEGASKELVSETGKAVAITLGDDLNTPAALAFVNHMVEQSQENGIGYDELTDVISSIDELFGLDLGKQEDASKPAKDLLKKRREARENNNYEASDQIRDELAKIGYEVKDTKNGQQWGRTRQHDK